MCKQLIVGLVLILGLTSTVFAEDIVIGNWENSLDGWSNGNAVYEWNANLLGYSSIGATLGSKSLIVQNGQPNYWVLMSSPVLMGTDLRNAKFSIDATFIANEWPNPPWPDNSRVKTDSLGIQTSTDGVNWDWRQINMDSGLVTVINRRNGEAIRNFWWPDDGDSDTTYTWDLSQLGIGPEATRYGVRVCVSIWTNQTFSTAGNVYLDNARLINVQPAPEPATLLLLTIGGLFLRNRKA